MSDSFMRQPLSFTPNATMTGTSTIKSQPFWLVKFSGVSFQPVWTGTPTGTFEVYVSNDYQPSATGSNTSPFNAGTWTSLNASISGNPAGSASNTFIPIYASCGMWIQLWYTNASGTGACSGTFVGKYGG